MSLGDWGSVGNLETASVLKGPYIFRFTKPSCTSLTTKRKQLDKSGRDILHKMKVRHPILIKLKQAICNTKNVITPLNHKTSLPFIAQDNWHQSKFKSLFLEKKLKKISLLLFFKKISRLKVNDWKLGSRGCVLNL